MDTAGRLHTKTNLMAELAKVKRVIGRQCAGRSARGAPRPGRDHGPERHRAGAGLPRGPRARRASCCTKLDGTAKGGIVIRIYRELGVPIKLVATGEKPEDLAPFEPDAYVDALVGA